MGKKVIAAGHVCLDITPAFPDGRISDLGTLFEPGKLIEVGKVTVSSGGAAANTGLAMKLLGSDVMIMGKTGRDQFGDMLCGLLDAYGAENGMIRTDGEETSYTVVLAVPGTDRIFLHNPGANNTFNADDISEEAITGADLFHFGYPPLMRSMYEDDGSGLVRLMQKVKAAGCSTSLDMAAVDPESEAGTADWKKILEKVMPYLDFFVPSAEELCYMLDRGRLLEWKKRADGRDITEVLDFSRDIRPLADQCMELGCRVLLIKCGARGMYLKTAPENVLEGVSVRAGLNTAIWAGREIFEKAYVPRQIVSATGAGDACIAAFLTSVLGGECPGECLHLAAAAGACCVEAYDSLSGLKPLAELKQRIAAGWAKN